MASVILLGLRAGVFTLDLLIFVVAMKKSLFILLLFPCISHAQTILDSLTVNDEGSVYFEKVFEVKGTKDELYSKGKLWLSQMVHDLNAALVNDDKPNGTLVIKTNMDVAYVTQRTKNKGVELNPFTSTIYFTLKLYFKDDKAKILVDNIQFEKDFYHNLRDLNASYIKDVNAMAPKSAKEADTKRSYSLFVNGIANSINNLQQQFYKVIIKKSEADF